MHNFILPKPYLWDYTGCFDVNKELTASLMSNFLLSTLGLNPLITCVFSSSLFMFWQLISLSEKKWWKWIKSSRQRGVVAAEIHDVLSTLGDHFEKDAKDKDWELIELINEGMILIGSWCCFCLNTVLLWYIIYMNLALFTVNI